MSLDSSATTAAVAGTLSLVARASPETLASPRYAELAELFRKTYGQPPEFFARAPGRVNLIGEHIDYCGYAVLPFALEQDVLIAAAPRGAGEAVEVANAEGERFSRRSWAAGSEAQGESGGDWSDYVRAAFRGVADQAASRGVGVRWRGVAMAVHGTVPAGSGLSSSSALVVASSLACVHANALHSLLSPEELAAGCAEAERYVGTAGGGMDQAISVLGRAGAAKLVEFEPRLAASDVALPAGHSFVVAHTLVRSEKRATAAQRFNARVAECRLASALLAHALGLDWRACCTRLRRAPDAAGLTLEQAEALALSALRAEPAYTAAEVAALLGADEGEVRARCVPAGVPDGALFELRPRAAHVFSEARRVLEFARAPSGKLMSASHASCRDSYACSCAELDEIVRVAEEAGAAGARLTGAGWGGCAVAMVADALVPQVLAALRERYYARVPDKPAHEADYLFVTRPAPGASVLLS